MEKMLTRNVQTDWNEGLVLVRDATGNATAVGILPGAADSITPDTTVNSSIQGTTFPQGGPGGTNAGPTINRVFYTKGAKTIGLVIWGTGTTAPRLRVTATGFLRDGPHYIKAATPTLTKSAGILLFDYTVEINTSGTGTANTHPITGATVAATTFYPADNINTNTFERNPLVVQSPTNSANGGSKIIFMDCAGMDRIVVEFPSTFTNVTRAVAGMWRLD